MTAIKNHILCLEDVHVQYPTNQGGIKKVLNDIDVRVSEGEFITVVGPSGCGKSTLLRLILGAEQPTSGTVLLDGKSIDGPDRNRGIVYQKYSLFRNRTVIENVTFGLELERFNLVTWAARKIIFQDKLKKFREEALEYLDHVGLGSDADKYPYQLSGGMRQRAAIARAMIMKPKILLMDEPFGALDDSTRQSMQVFLIEQWRKTGMTIFFVTHDLEEAIFLGTRILVISPHYATDMANEGSKIVTDKKIPVAHSADFKYQPEFNALLKQIREDGLDPEHRQHVKDFDLSHPDSFRTVSAEEWRR